MSILSDEMVKQINDDLYAWGHWVESFRPVQGHTTLWARRDETLSIKPKSRYIEIYGCNYHYVDGTCVAAHASVERKNAPIEPHKLPKEIKVKQAHEERDDELALEIDGYLCELKQENKQARSLANHIYRWHKPREAIMQEMRISKERYYRLKEYIPVFVMGRRLARVSGVCN